MATRTTIQITSDLSGEPDAQTVRFSYGDDVAWEIDLTQDEVTEFDALMLPYVEHARRATPRAAAPKVGKHRNRSDDSAQIRTWAREHGWPQMGARGRIPAEVRAAYEQATLR